VSSQPRLFLPAKKTLLAIILCIIIAVIIAKPIRPRSVSLSLSLSLSLSPNLAYLEKKTPINPHPRPTHKHTRAKRQTPNTPQVAQVVGGDWLAWWVVAAAAASQVGQFQAEMSADAYQLQVWLRGVRSCVCGCGCVLGAFWVCIKKGGVRVKNKQKNTHKKKQKQKTNKTKKGMAERGFLPLALARRSRHGTPTLGILASSVGVVALAALPFVSIVELLNAVCVWGGCVCGVCVCGRRARAHTHTRHKTNTNHKT
jgi:amino acid transporter